MSSHSPRFPPAAISSVVVALFVLLPILSGCATIPDSGPVISGRVLEPDRRVGLVRVSGEGPVRGATPEAIVSGFLLVAAGFNENHRVARSFLAPQRRLAWRPDAAVVVYPTRSRLKVKEIGVTSTPTPTPTTTAAPAPGPQAADPRVVATTDPGAASADVRDRAEVTRVTVTTPIKANIDREGRYRTAAPGTTVSTTFALVKLGGEWRISSLSDGILIAETDFVVTFRPFSVYFGDPSGRYLVPDVHWFPAVRGDPSAPKLPTALVRALLAGPPTWLSQSLTTGAPGGTAMAVAAVVVADDVATVDLTDQVRQAKTPQRQLLAAQLEATLAQLRIASVKITVRRAAFDVPAVSVGSPGNGGSDPTQPDGQRVADPRVDARPVLIDTKGRLARYEAGKATAIDGLDGLAVPDANRPAVSYDSSVFAVLNGDRSELLLQRPGAKAVSLITSNGLTAPSFDPQGWVWTSPGTNTGFVYAASPGSDAAPVKVKTSWLKGTEVVSLRVSRDGTRAVLAVRIRGEAHLFVTGVVRDAEGAPEILSHPPPGLFPDLAAVSDVAWIDEDDVVVLGRRAGIDGEGPWRVQIGGVIAQIGAEFPGAESITAGNGQEAVMAGTGKNILGRSGALWAKLSPGRWPALPG